MKYAIIECKKLSVGLKMENLSGSVIIAITCVIVLFMGVIRKKMEWMLNMIMRSILGTIAIYFINVGLKTMGISLGVGVNAATVLTCGILGIPGVLALYGLGFYHSL